MAGQFRYVWRMAEEIVEIRDTVQRSGIVHGIIPGLNVIEEPDITADIIPHIMRTAYIDSGGAMKSECEVNCAVNRYADTVRRICFLHLKNYSDTEDIFQSVFLKYMLYNGTFCDKDHEKAWIIRVTINACKDLLKSFYHKNVVSLEDIYDIEDLPNIVDSEVFDSVTSLPKKYKDVVYLHYYEGYTALEISKMIGKKENTVYTLLSRARRLLKERLGGEGFE